MLASPLFISEFALNCYFYFVTDALSCDSHDLFEPLSCIWQLRAALVIACIACVFNMKHVLCAAGCTVSCWCFAYDDTLICICFKNWCHTTLTLELMSHYTYLRTDAPLLHLIMNWFHAWSHSLRLHLITSWYYTWYATHDLSTDTILNYELIPYHTYVWTETTLDFF